VDFVIPPFAETLLSTASLRAIGKRVTQPFTLPILVIQTPKKPVYLATLVLTVAEPVSNTNGL
jgi:hypothetical protein